MSNHCEKRNEVVWMHSLRGEAPTEDLSLKGKIILILKIFIIIINIHWVFYNKEYAKSTYHIII